MRKPGSSVACASRTSRRWVVFGGPKDVGLTDEERRGLEACPTATLIDWPNAGHNTLGQTPAVADLIVEVAQQA
jgi:hypothetical protein